MTTRWSLVVGRWSKLLFAVSLALIVASGALVLRAQTADTTELRTQLAERYNLVPLQNGVALVPLKGGTAVRLIEVKDGVVSINGDPVSAKDLKQRLGKDADLLLRVTYLDAAAAKALAAPSATAAPVPPSPPSPPAVDRRGDDDKKPRPESDGSRTEIRRGDIVRFGGSVTVAENESVDGDVVAIGGSADISGEVRGELTVVGGSATLGPKSHVHRNVTVVGGSLDRAPGARIDGKVDEVGVGAMGPRMPNVRIRPSFGTFWRFGSLLGTLLRVTLLAMGALLVTALGARHVESIGSRAVADPLRSGLTGLLAEVLFVPLVVITCVVLAVSIIGIPLLILVPFAIVLTLVLMLVGFTGVVHEVGRWLAGRFNIAGGMYVQVLVGLLAVVAVLVIARVVGVFSGFGLGFISGVLGLVGIMVEYAAWTIGAGAVILTWYHSRRKSGMDVPPPAAPSVNEVPAQ